MAGNLLGDFIDDYRKRVMLAAFSFKDIVYRLLAVLLTTSFIVWLSVFIYVSFYYSYVPTISHNRPVNLEFSSCQDDAVGVCSYPTANITLTHQRQLLKSGQPYNIILDLEVPESETNKRIGMFMVHLKLTGRDGRFIGSSRRSSMLRYKSSALHLLYTVFFSPLLLTETMEEKQVLKVEMFSNFLESTDNPVTHVWIEIESRWLQFYSSKLRLQAEFTGLRYFMFYWPVLSATIGIATHVVILSFLIGYIWYRILNPSQVVVRVGMGPPRTRLGSTAASMINSPSSPALLGSSSPAASTETPSPEDNSKPISLEQRRKDAVEKLRQRKLSSSSSVDFSRVERSASFSASTLDSSPVPRIQELPCDREDSFEDTPQPKATS